MRLYTRFVCATLLAGLVLLAGCGQKGPLYLPEEEEVSENPAPLAEDQETQGAD